MTSCKDEIPGIADEFILALLLQGEAKTLHEAEEKYLDAAMPQILKLLGSSASNEELATHPLLRMVLSHGSRSWEDSVL